VDDPRWLFLARAILSLIILFAGIYIILSGHFTDTLTEWACGVIGVVIGYWLR